MKLYQFVHTILFVPFCPIPFCPYTILSIPICPYHFVRYYFVRSPGHGCSDESTPSSPVLRSAPGGEKADVGWFQVGLNTSTVRVDVSAGLPLRLFQSHGWP